MPISTTVAVPEKTAPVIHERSWLFGLMIAPTGTLANGLVQGGALAYLLSTQGIGSGAQSHLIALLGIPTWLYFVWSPLTDFFVKRRTWLLIGGLGAGGLIVVAFHQPHLTSRSAVVLMFASTCLVQLVVSSCGGIMAGLHSDMNRKRASSFYQAGSMGFGALAACVLVYMSSRVQQGTLGWIAGAMIALPTLSALATPVQQALSKGSFGDSLRSVSPEFRRMALAILWLGHLDPRTYFIGVTLYLFTVGSSYAASTSVILEFMGDAGTSGSMRYSLINSLGNVPVQYMILVDGWGGDHFGVRGLAGSECVVGAVTTVLFLSWLLITRPTSPAGAPVMRLPFTRIAPKDEQPLPASL